MKTIELQDYGAGIEIDALAGSVRLMVRTGGIRSGWAISPGKALEIAGALTDAAIAAKPGSPAPKSKSPTRSGPKRKAAKSRSIGGGTKS